jgi:hypothetical protein
MTRGKQMCEIKNKDYHYFSTVYVNKKQGKKWALG